MSISGSLPSHSPIPHTANQTNAPGAAVELPPMRHKAKISLEAYQASGKKDAYLDFRLRGTLPAGPFDPAVEGSQARVLGELVGRLVAEDEPEALAFLLERCGELRHLEVVIPSPNSDKALEGLCLALRDKQPHIKSLTLKGLVDVTDSARTFDVLAQCNQLTGITVDQLSEKAAPLLFQALANHPALEKLVLPALVIKEPETARSFTKMISSLPKLSSLALYLGTTRSNEKLIMDALSELPVRDRLKSLALHCGGLCSAESLACLGKLVSESQSLSRLHLEANRLRFIIPHEIRNALSASFSKSASLTSVTLKGVVASEFAKPVISAAASATRIVELDFDRPTLLAPDTLEALADLLEKRNSFMDVFSGASDEDLPLLLDEDRDTAHPAYRSDDSDVSDDEQAEGAKPPMDNTERYKAAAKTILDLLNRNRAGMSEMYADTFVERDWRRVHRAHLDTDTSQKLVNEIFNYSADMSEFIKVMEEVRLITSQPIPDARTTKKSTDN